MKFQTKLRKSVTNNTFLRCLATAKNENYGKKLHRSDCTNLRRSSKYNFIKYCSKRNIHVKTFFFEIGNEIWRLKKIEIDVLV